MCQPTSQTATTSLITELALVSLHIIFHLHHHTRLLSHLLAQVLFSWVQPTKPSQFAPSAWAKTPTTSTSVPSDTCWGKSKARCHRNEQGRLVNLSDSVLCLNWNSHCGCTTTGHEQCHKCSRCRNKDHGAQACPQAQKAPSSHTL